MGLILATLLVAGRFEPGVSVHQEEQMRYAEHQIEVPMSIAQPVLKTGHRVVGSQWQVHGYYPYWASQDAEIPWSALSHLIYFSLELNADGTLGDEHQWLTRGQSLVDEGHRHGVKVLPCVTMFDDEAIRAMLGSAAARDLAVTALVDRVRATGADGINLDFEFVPSSNGESPTPKQNFVTFVTELKSALIALDPNLELSLATPAVDWSGTYDYDALAEVSDGLLIMGYGYHWAGGPPGPISPIDIGTTWTSRSLTWTLNDYDTYGLVENRSKFILGLPLYGRQWPTTDSSVPGTERSTGVAVSLSECDQRFLEAKRWDEDSSTPYKVFEQAAGWEQLFCEDLESLQLKYALIQQRGIGGLMFWDVSKIPGDHPGWSDVREVFGVESGDETDPSSVTEPSDLTDAADPSDSSDSSDSSDASELSEPCDVTDPTQGSEPSQADSVPVVVVIAAEAVEVGQLVTLDASQSYDEDGDALGFQWSQLTGLSIEWLEGPNSAVASARLESPGTYRFKVEVSDGENTASASVEVIALAAPGLDVDESGCTQNSGVHWLALLIGVQFATYLGRTYKRRRAAIQ